MQVTNIKTSALRNIIAALAITTKVSQQDVLDNFIKAGVEDIKKVSNAAGAMALFMINGHKLVDPALEEQLKARIVIGALMGDYGPAADLSELAEYLQKVPTTELKTAAAGHPVGEIKRRELKVGDKVRVLRHLGDGSPDVGSEGVLMEDFSSLDGYARVKTSTRNPWHPDGHLFASAELELMAA